MFRTMLIAVIASVAVMLAAGVAQARTTLVEVDAPGAAGAVELERLGLDVVHIGADAVEVQVHTAHDERRLRASGYDSRVLIADMDGHNRRARETEERREARGLASGLPTGRVSYRTLDEINAELRQLAVTHPRRVKLFQLPHRSLLGKRIWASRSATTSTPTPASPRS